MFIYFKNSASPGAHATPSSRTAASADAGKKPGTKAGSVMRTQSWLPGILPFAPTF